MYIDVSYFVNTVDLSVNYLTEIPVGDLLIESKCVNFNSKFAFVESNCYANCPKGDENDKKLVAISTSKFNIYKSATNNKSTELLHMVQK